MPILPSANPACLSHVLILVAAPSEAAAVASAFGAAAPANDRELVELGQNACLVRAGVGKVNAALAVARCVDPAAVTLIVNLGIGGLLPAIAPDTGDLHLLDTVVASTSLYADEGVRTPTGFIDIAQAGFPPGGNAFAGMGVEDAGTARLILDRLKGATGINRVDWAATLARIATVSTCSGTDQLAHDVAQRTRARIEAMEGAAAGHAAACLFGSRVKFAEVRVISNTTGDRSRQVWKIPESLARLGEIARLLVTGASG